MVSVTDRRLSCCTVVVTRFDTIELLAGLMYLLLSNFIGIWDIGIGDFNNSHTNVVIITLDRNFSTHD